MAETIIIVLAAIWLLVFGSIITVKIGGIPAAIMYKAFPIGIAFGLVLVALKLI